MIKTDLLAKASIALDGGPTVSSNRIVDCSIAMEEHKEALDLIETLRNLFAATDNIHFIDLAIQFAERLMTSDPSVATVQKLQAHLSSMSEVRRNNPAKANKTGEKNETKKTNEAREVIEVIEETAVVIPPSRDDQARSSTHLTDMSNVFFQKFQQFGGIEDLNEAIRIAEKAEATAPPDHPIQSRVFNNLGNYYFSRFHRTGARIDLDKAIDMIERSITTTPLVYPHRPKMLGNLGTSLFDRFKRFGASQDLDRAIRASEDAVLATPPDHSIRGRLLINFGSYLFHRFNHSGGLVDLAKAIRACEDAATATPSNHPLRAKVLKDLGSYLFHRFKRFGILGDIDKAIRASEEAIAALPPDNLDRISELSNLGKYLSRRFQRLGTLDDLNRAIWATEQAIAASPPDHPSQADRLSALSEHWFNRFERMGVMGDITEAIRLREKAVAAIPLSNSDRNAGLSDLGMYFYRRFSQSGDIEDLEKAVQMCEEAIAATTAGHPSEATRLSDMGRYLSDRFHRLGFFDDLDKAIRASKKALEATPLSHLDRPGRLSSMSGYLSDRFERFGELGDLEEAIRASREAVAATPPIHPNRPERFNNLSKYLSNRFNRFGSMEDLDNAIKAAKEAVAAAPPIHTQRSSILNNLGTYLSDRFSRVGDLEDLDEAIQTYRQAIGATVPSNPLRVRIISNLSSNYFKRFQRLGTLGDLEEAIQASEEAVAASPADHPLRARILSNLSGFRSNRFKRLGALDDLDIAIRVGEEAVAVALPGHPSRILMLSSLGSDFSDRFKRFGAPDDLDNAIRVSEEAVAATPPGHPSRADILNSASKRFHRRYQRSGAPEDRAEAIRMGETAVAVTPKNDPKRAIILLTLALVHDPPHALNFSLQAWACHLSPPRARIIAAHIAARFLAASYRWEEANSLLKDAFKILPLVSSQFLNRDDREHMPSEFSQFPAEAMSIALQAGEPASDCLGFLELGKRIIMGFAINYRSDLSDLQAENPEIFNKYNRLRIKINSPSTKKDDNFTDEDLRRRQTKAIHNVEKTLDNIRRLPGFKQFQLPPSSDDLIAMAAEGPIVFVNTTEIRSDAIIVTSSVIMSLPLPKLVFSEANDQMRRLTSLARGYRSTFTSRNIEMGKVLLWLWEVVVEPVFEKLRFRAVDDSDLPRVWWIGAGPLAVAPFHAAGDHSRGSTRNTLSQAISSYIPTIKALSYARQKKLVLGPDPRLLLITMPTTPDTLATPGNPTKKWKSLRCATKEASEITAAVEKNSSTLVARFDYPSATQVLERLPLYHAIHFACHSVFDDKDPSKTHLLLLGGDLSKSRSLTLGEISKNIKNSQIAYLSACSTVENPSARLFDESIHIASAFQLAGFSHVLATLWESNDDSCREFATEFYRLLFDAKGGDKGHKAVSIAFHRAMKTLRNGILEQPIKWAPFFHTGA